MPTRKPARTKKFEEVLQALQAASATQDLEADRLVSTTFNDADTRQKIAKRFVNWYFALFLVILIGGPLYNLAAHGLTGGDTYKLDLIEIVQGYSAVVGPLIGFVIAYYFKDKNNPN